MSHSPKGVSPPIDDSASDSGASMDSYAMPVVDSSEMGHGPNRHATRFVETLRLADSIGFLSERLMDVRGAEMDEETAAAIFHQTSDLIIAIKTENILTGDAVIELLEMTVIQAMAASNELGQDYSYGEGPSIAETENPALVAGLLAIVAPQVLKILGFPDNDSDTVPGSFAEDWLSKI